MHLLRHRTVLCIKAFFLLSAIALASCAGRKTLSSEELHSDVVSAISLASETDAFAGQIEQRRLTREFQSGHAAYLRDEAERQAKELRKSAPQANQAQTVHSCIEQLDLLARDLSRIAKTTTDKTQIPAIREEVQRVVQSLTGLKAQL